jgi:long-chain acyl-CoA synthetase
MLEVWGMTETCGASTFTPMSRIKPGMIGLAAPYNEMKVDPQTGELMVRGTNVFMGYLNMPEKTAETITPTAGCTPATWAWSTPTATTASPTG